MYLHYMYISLVPRLLRGLSPPLEPGNEATCTCTALGILHMLLPWVLQYPCCSITCIICPHLHYMYISLVPRLLRGLSPPLEPGNEATCTCTALCIPHMLLPWVLQYPCCSITCIICSLQDSFVANLLRLIQTMRPKKKKKRKYMHGGRRLGTINFTSLINSQTPTKCFISRGVLGIRIPPWSMFI